MPADKNKKSTSKKKVDEGKTTSTYTSLYGTPQLNLTSDQIQQAINIDPKQQIELKKEVLSRKPYLYSVEDYKQGITEPGAETTFNPVELLLPAAAAEDLLVQGATELGKVAAKKVGTKIASKLAGKAAKNITSSATKNTSLANINIDPERLEDAKSFLQRRQFIKDLQSKGLIGKDFTAADVNYAARSTDKTNKLTQLALDRDATRFRGVEGSIPIGGKGKQEYTGVEFDMTKPSFGTTISELKNMEYAGVDFNDPVSIAKYQATHVPMQQYKYRSGMPDMKYVDALYAGKSPTGYGNYMIKMQSPRDYSLGNYQDWFNKYNPESRKFNKLAVKYDKGQPYYDSYFVPNTTYDLPILLDNKGTVVGLKGQKMFDVDESYPFMNYKKLSKEDQLKYNEFLNKWEEDYNTGWKGQYQSGGWLDQYQPGGYLNTNKGKEFAEDRTKRSYYYYLGESNKSKLLDDIALAKSRRTPYKKGGKLEDKKEEPEKKETTIVRDFMGDTYYSPVEDTIYLSAVGDEFQEIPHEMYHAQQAKSGRLRSSYYDPYGKPRRKPSIVEEQAFVDYPYYNRPLEEKRAYMNEFLRQNPSFQFVNLDNVYRDILNPRIYSNPETAEGEARAAEFPEGRAYLESMGIGVQERAEGGFLNEYLEEDAGNDGDKNKKAKPTTKSGIDKELLIRQQFKESSFNPKAKSGANARGLAQIMENVEQDAIKAGVLKKGEDIYDPKVNAKVQKWYMEDLYNSSFINKPGQKEDVKKAKVLASYNYGRGNILKHLNEQKAKGVDIYNSYDWLKGLPAETTDYVEKILLKKDPNFEKEYSKAVKKYSYKAKGGWLDNYADGGKVKNLKAERSTTDTFYSKQKPIFKDSGPMQEAGFFSNEGNTPEINWILQHMEPFSTIKDAYGIYDAVKRLDKADLNKSIYSQIIPFLNYTDIELPKEVKEAVNRTEKENIDIILKRNKKASGGYMFSNGGKFITVDGEYHRVYENKDGDIVVNHPKEDKGKWDTINLTDKANAKTIADGVKSVKKWHKENPETKAKGGWLNKYM